MTFAPEAFYDRFVSRTRERAQRVQSLSFPALRAEAHAIAGEAALLGLHGCAEVAASLGRTSSRLATSPHHEQALARCRGWFSQLAQETFVLAKGDPGANIQLEALNLEVHSAMTDDSWFSPPEAGSEGGDGRRVLILDDSELTRDTLCDLLEGEGYQVAAAGDLVEFEKTLSAFRPEIILSDINMPDIQGDEVCRVLKTRFETDGVPIVLVSGIPPNELEVRAERAGADHWISKEEGPDRVVEVLGELLSEILF